MSDSLPAPGHERPPARRRWRPLLLLAVLLGVGTLLALQQARRKDAVPTPRPTAAAPLVGTPELDALKATLARQETRIAALEQAAAGAAQADTSPTAEPEQAAPKPVAANALELIQLGQQVAEARAGLEALRAETRAQGLPVRNLQSWVLLQQVAQAVDRGGPTTLPVAQLQEAWIGSAPNELEDLRILARAAEQRIPTEAMLMEDFIQLRGDVSASLLQKEAGLWARMKAMLREQIRVRRLDAAGEALPEDPLAALDEAQDALAQGRVADAVRRVEAVPQGKAAFEPWLESAARRLEAQKAVADLQQSLLAQLTAQPIRHAADALSRSPSAAADADASE